LEWQIGLVWPRRAAPAWWFGREELKSPEMSETRGNIRFWASGTALYRSALAVAVAALYLRTAGYPYIQFDDHKHIFENPQILNPSWSAVAQFWKTPFFGLYIPFTYSVWVALSYLSPGRAAGAMPDPGFFHLVNAALHLASTLLLFSVLERLLRKRAIAIERARGAAFLGALLFAVHPLQVEAVAWISGMKDVLYGFLGLVAVQQYLVWRSAEGRWFSYAVASVAFGLALLSKPTAIVIAPFLLLLNRFFLGDSWSDARKGLLPWLGLCVPFVLVTMHLQPSATLKFVPTWWQRLFIASDALGFYLRKLLLPHPLLLDYGRLPEIVVTRPGDWAVGIFLCGLAALGLWKSRRNAPWVTGSGLLLALGIFPVSGLVSFQFQNFSTVSDHYLYFSMVGAALGLAFFLAERPRWAQGAVLALLVVYGGLSHLQVEHWRKDETLFGHTLRHNPDSLFSRTNLSYALVASGRAEEALPHLAEAARLRPSEPSLKLGLAHGLLMASRFRQARDLCEELERKEPSLRVPALNCLERPR
jgi:protein O-mannosyl-transferase